LPGQGRGFFFRRVLIVKCLVLEVKNVKGKWPVVELGAPYVSNGDTIYLKEGSGAEKFYKQYSKHLEKKGTKEMPTLRGGTYQVNNGESAVEAPAETPAPTVADKSMKNKARRKTKKKG
jgi:hypothetical protein